MKYLDYDEHTAIMHEGGLNGKRLVGMSLSSMNVELFFEGGRCLRFNAVAYDVNDNEIDGEVCIGTLSYEPHELPKEYRLPATDFADHLILKHNTGREETWRT